ncbi:hypothetical protein GMRT_13382 [Giardia muris]|uniref:Uncharacterized protein n=1 Tax=Giardia muris TaxID=5742 RepID=A0A4Z1T1D7_GIAMU|nr:hypothetical protein GMRT_13382 [Giardia muris]|eukprot:TNJ26349.1 hypothetical protein GMRT_13382 [Giardia muris]
MFTSRSRRDPGYIGKTDVPAKIGPGYYNTDRSTLRISPYVGQAPFQTTAANDDTFDQEVKRGAAIPPPGMYDIQHDPTYIRGAAQEHSAFASVVPRFRDATTDTPAPTQYRNIAPDMSAAGHTAHIQRKKRAMHRAVRNRLADGQGGTASSIPYTVRTVDRGIRRVGRDGWVVEATMSMADNPGPGAYIQQEALLAEPSRSQRRRGGAEGRAGTSALIPVGGASSSIARPSFLPAMKKTKAYPYAGTLWVRAQGRAPLFSAGATAQVGPGDYELGGTDIAQQVDYSRPSAAFLAPENRFSHTVDKDLAALAPNSYRVEDVDSIARRQQELRQQVELRREVKRSLKRAMQISEQLHPSVAHANREGREAQRKESSLPPFLSMEEKTRAANPAVGQYDAPRSDFDKIVAQHTASAYAESDMPTVSVNRLALRQTFGVQKWPETTASIPDKVIVEEDEASATAAALIEQEREKDGDGNAIRAGVAKAARVPDIGKALGRDQTSDIAGLTKGREHLGPGSYNDLHSFNRVSQRKDFATAPSSVFASAVPRNTIHKEAVRKQLEEELAEENMQRHLELQGEKRAIGGAETAVSFIKSRYDGPTTVTGEPCKMYNNSSMERDTNKVLLSQFDLSIPGSTAYNTATEQRGNATVLYTHDRIPAKTDVPDVLRPEIAGPSAVKAAKVLLDERSWSTPGPGQYTNESTFVKRSFNVLAEDNL